MIYMAIHITAGLLAMGYDYGLLRERIPTATMMGVFLYDAILGPFALGMCLYTALHKKL